MSVSTSGLPPPAAEPSPASTPAAVPAMKPAIRLANSDSGTVAQGLLHAAAQAPGAAGPQAGPSATAPQTGGSEAAAASTSAPAVARDPVTMWNIVEEGEEEVRGSTPNLEGAQQGGEEGEEEEAEEEGEGFPDMCWHEVHALLVPDPVTGQQVGHMGRWGSKWGPGVVGQVDRW